MFVTVSDTHTHTDRKNDNIRQ